MNCAHCNKASRGIHPDIIVVDKTGKKREIVVDQIRELRRDAIVVPNEAAKKVYIISGADSMNINAQNALLRILEEPPSHAVFILSTDTPSELLPTVRSRCIELKAVTGASSRDAAVSDIVNGFFTAVRQGNAALAKFMFKLEKLDKNLLAIFIAASRERAADEIKEAVIRGGAQDADILSQIDRVLIRAGEFLDLNVGVGHISGLICSSLLKV
jgi:hypothetical protein